MKPTTLALALLVSVLFNIWAFYTAGKLQDTMISLSDDNAHLMQQLAECK